MPNITTVFYLSKAEHTDQFLQNLEIGCVVSNLWIFFRVSKDTEHEIDIIAGRELGSRVKKSLEDKLHHHIVVDATYSVHFKTLHRFPSFFYLSFFLQSNETETLTPQRARHILRSKLGSPARFKNQPKTSVQTLVNTCKLFLELPVGLGQQINWNDCSQRERIVLGIVDSYMKGSCSFFAVLRRRPELTWKLPEKKTPELFCKHCFSCCYGFKKFQVS